jgi:hypothetical protein
MFTPKLLKSGLIGMAFGICALGNGAYAASDEVDEKGMFKQPVCGPGPRIQNILAKIAGQQPSGITASNSKWDMEIYLDKAEGDWTLVGKSKAPDASPRKLCMVAAGLSNDPFEKKPWFKEDFAGR